MLRRRIATVLLPWYLAACTTWRVQNLTPQQVVDQHPAAVRVTTADSAQRVLVHPRIVGGDSLAAGTDTVPGVAIADIRHVAIRKTSVGKTLGLIFGIQAAAFAVIMATGGIDVVPNLGGLGGH